MDLVGKRIALLVDNYFEQAEFTGPKQSFLDAGASVTVVSPQSGTVQGLKHVDKGDTFAVDQSLDDADADSFDALVLPGGAINADHLRMNKKAQEWIRRYIERGKIVAAICHAPWLLVSADCVRGRHLTSFFTIQDDIRNAGGKWSDEQVVIDGSLITSRKPDDVPAFADAIKQALAAK
ncbi:MAG TPA: type 1 glutamine amidotransferase domain-containing protein [Candidatus Saccharimonadales bacterium]|jgi:protease I|nr:type 1 glutamine amidotransferase domain-containing protein [Candidatus Saccharimonadales bacterium]